MLLLNLRYHAIQITCVRSLSAGVLTLDAQVDPGPRGGPANAGAYYSELNITEQLFFTQGSGAFQGSRFRLWNGAKRGGLRPRPNIQRE